MRRKRAMQGGIRCSTNRGVSMTTGSNTFKRQGGGACGAKRKESAGVGVRGGMCEGVEEWRTERNKQQSKV